MSEHELVDSYMKLYTEAKWLKEQLTLLKKAHFGSASEKIVTGQLNLFNEIEDLYDHRDRKEDLDDGAEGLPKKRKKTKEADFSNLSTTVIHHELEDQHCEERGTLMTELAPQIMDVLKYLPARYTLERHILPQYVCPKCSEENLASEIIAAPGAPKRLIPGSKVSPSVLAGLIFNKYVSGIPLYRQEQELHRKKIEISRMTMSNWLMKDAESIQSLYQQMRQDLQILRHIHMNETTVTVLEDKKNRTLEELYVGGCQR